MRDKKIDLLRFIALSSLILAHIEGPRWLMQLNNFNVPLIVMASAMALSYSQPTQSYWSYVWKRVRRLVFPVWLFLTFYFVFIWITGIAPKYLTPQYIWSNYTFANAGGFMWIIRVFLLIALCAPLIYRFDNLISSNKVYLVLFLISCAVYENFLHWIDMWPDGSFKEFIESYGCYAIGYGLILSLGMRLRKVSAKELFLLGFVSFLFFLTFCVALYNQEGHFVDTQNFKYPPSAYYVSYALSASISVIWLVDFICKILGGQIWLEGAVMFIARNSLWIYFWHTIFLFIAYRLHDQSFVMKYFVVYSLSVLAVYLQVNIVKSWILPRISSDKGRKEIQGLLTG